MVNYRRNRVENGTYFFTIALKNRGSDLLVRRISCFRQAWAAAKKRIPHGIVATVVLPDHIHALITMQDGQDDYPRMWQDIKKGFTRRVKSSKSPWQPRYWEHTIRDPADLQTHFDYVHINPVKHGLVTQAVDWPYSTIHRYIRRGVLTSDWATDETFSDRFGEPLSE